MARVSVIIPCYNHGKYIGDAVNSILRQTYQDFEIIIVNDGSTEEFTNDILDNKSFQKTKVIRTDHNGVPKARNIGIENSVGEYILTLDADDTFEPSFLSKAVKILDERKDVGVVTCGIRYFGSMRGSAYPIGGGVKNCLVQSNACGNSLFRKKCWSEVGGYNEDMTEGFEDWDFWLSVTEKGWIVHTINEILFNYRTRSVSRDTEANKKRAKIFRLIIMNHRDSYVKYLDHFIFRYELENQTKLERLLNSKSFRLGEWILSPLRKMERFLSFIDRA